MKTISGAAVIMILLTSCAKVNDMHENVLTPLSLDSSSINLSGNAGSADSFHITYSGEWTINVSFTDSAWVNLSDTHGSGNKTILVKALSNNRSDSARSVIIAVTGANGTTPLQITCRQDQYQSSVFIPNVYGGSEYDGFNAAVATPDGGTLAVGYSLSVDGDLLKNRGKRDLWVVKMDASGKKIWSKTFGGSDDEEGDAVVATGDGGFIISGYTRSSDGDVSSNHGGWDAWVIKIDNNGNKIWEKTFGGTGGERGFGLSKTSDGNYMMAAEASSTNGDVQGNHSNLSDVWLVKFDGSGQKLWSKCYGSNSEEVPFSVTESPSGGFVVAGYSTSNIADGDVHATLGALDIWVFKVDDQGSLVWEKTLGNPNVDFAWKVIPTTDDAYLVTGYTTIVSPPVNGTSHTQSDFILSKLDESGNLLWQKTMGGSGEDWGVSMVPTSTGGAMVAAYSNSPDNMIPGNHGGIDAWIMDIDEQGEVLWQQLYGGSKNDVPAAIVLNGNDKYTVVGRTPSTDGDLTGTHGDWDGWAFTFER